MRRRDGRRPSRSQELHGRHARRLLSCDAFIICCALAIATAAAVLGGRTTADFPWTSSTLTGYATLSVVLGALWLAFLGVSGALSRRVVGRGLEEYTVIVLASLQLFGLMALIAQLVEVDLSRSYLAIALAVGITALMTNRMIWRGIVDHRRRAGEDLVTVLVVGNPPAAAELVTMFAREPEAGYEVVGACTPTGPTSSSPSLIAAGRVIPVIGKDTGIVEAVRRTGVSTVALAATDDLSGNDIRRLMWELEALGVDLMMVPGLMDVADHRLRTRLIGGMAVLEVDTPQYHGANSTAKRVFDVVFAAAALIIAIPLLLAAAVAVSCSSRGPVLYRSRRIGLGGEPFTMYKLRTMYEGSDAMQADLMADHDGRPLFFKIKDDPRITPVGRLLRKYSIDELPQLLNVLRNDMSIVGPRPQVQREVDSYDDLVRNRLAVKPGLTGLWQISGRSDLRTEDAVRLDLTYVENWSLIRDLLIIAKTAKTVLLAEGAY